MPMFDYKGADARALVAEAYDLSLFYSQGAPAGWRALTAQELGVDPSNVDSGGYFRGTSLPGAQAHVLGKFDADGRLTRLSVSFTATNDGDDPGDYGAMDNDTYANDFDYLLDAVRVYAPGQGLDGADVIVTGYSLGAGAMNTMAAQRDTSWGGFYANSDYIGVAVPKLTEVANVLNFGFENDVVHKIVGEGDKDAQAANPLHGVQHNDRAYATSTDNIVLFNDVYAGGGFEAVPITLGDIPRGWAAHTDIPDENWVRRIGSSTFYERIEMDSPVVIAHLGEELRPVVWVEDKQTMSSSHFGQSAFILGSDLADRLGDGTAGDFLDGFAGDDTIRLGGGDDRVHGGEGTDTVQLTGPISGYERVRLADGTLYLRDGAGSNGLESLVSVERLTTRDPLDSVVYDVTAGGLTAAGQPTLAWAAHREGTAGADTLSAAGAAGERLFGLAGNDTLTGGAGADWLHGGAGNDVLRGGAGADTLTGWDGVDTADYTGTASFVRIDLMSGTALGGAGADRLSGIENVRGTAFNDILLGDGVANVLLGAAGDDSLKGGDGDDVLWGGAGTDTLDGGAGADTAQYQDATAGVRVTLVATGHQTTGGGGVDRLLSIENVIGSNFNDLLTGNGEGNVLTGAGGADTLRGGGGNDGLSGGAQNDLLTGDEGDDKLHGGDGADRLEGGAGRDILIGAAGADTFVFSRLVGADTVVDFGADDTLALRAASFGLAAGAFDAARLQFGAAATGAEGVFVYDAARRTLSWDPDGAGGAAAEMVAAFSTPVSLGAGDFLLI
jgi:Ca2+-binding RTX toxin-like protein